MTTRAEFVAKLTELARALIPTIADDCRAYECECPLTLKAFRSGPHTSFQPQHLPDCPPSLQVTIGADDSGWGYQTGDNSYSGGAYGFANWGVAALYRDSDPAEFAEELVADLESVAPEDAQLFYDLPEDGPPTTTCSDCGQDYRDRDMLPLPDGGEVCQRCAVNHPELSDGGAA